MSKPALLLMFLTLGIPAAMAQQSNGTMPMIVGAALPLYPPLARNIRVEGMVHVRITTDGMNVVTAKALDGHPLLAAAAEENARTWQFANDVGTSFTMTYRYRMDPNMHPDYPNVRFLLPKEVEVAVAPLKYDTEHSH
jgi:hypothetical protein